MFIYGIKVLRAYGIKVHACTADVPSCSCGVEVQCSAPYAHVLPQACKLCSLHVWGHMGRLLEAVLGVVNSSAYVCLLLYVTAVGWHHRGERVIPSKAGEL